MRTLRALAACALAAAVLPGCVVAPAYSTDPYAGESVMVAPPPPRVEYYGAPPFAGAVWIGGNWSRSYGRYHWVPGRWEEPRHGHAWVPHRWEHSGDGWRERGGYWDGRRGGWR